MKKITAILALLTPAACSWQPALANEPNYLETAAVAIVANVECGAEFSTREIGEYLAAGARQQGLDIGAAARVSEELAIDLHIRLKRADAMDRFCRRIYRVVGWPM
jgi:hypothetical protein